MKHDSIAILDYGSQTAQLIARRVRELRVYCELIAWDAPADRIAALNPRGFILSGGPNSVYELGAPTLPPYVLESGKPVLGICYGMQLLAHNLGGRVDPSARREYGHAGVTVVAEDAPLLHGLPLEMSVWMSHGDHVVDLPPTFAPLATTPSSVAAMGDPIRGIYGVQFHPEVQHTSHGKALLRNFSLDVCGCKPDWTPANLIAESEQVIRAEVGDGHVICGLSGGVDSAVAASLIHRAVGDQLTCVFVNHGLLRQGEAEQVVETFQRHMGMRLVAVDAAEDFLTDLAGVTDPELKRKRIGNRFVRVFEAAAAQAAHPSTASRPFGTASAQDALLSVDRWEHPERNEVKSKDAGPAQFLAQGTLYPDVIESASRGEQKTARTIKTHHNVGGLPEDMQFKLIEPLRSLFKDEVRAVGEALGLPEEIVWRHPFPGPGLAIRVLGEVTWERLETLRAADAIFLEELRAAGLYRSVSQAFVVLLPVRSVGVMGDGRTYADTAAIRAVTTDDFMTADWARLPFELLAKISNRIVNEVSGVNRVVYDVSSKPPATIEWE